MNNPSQISPDGTTLYAAGYAAVPPATDTEPDTHGGDGAAAAAASAAAAAAASVWRYEMKPREIRALSDLGLRMEAFQGVFGTSVLSLALLFCVMHPGNLRSMFSFSERGMHL